MRKTAASEWVSIGHPDKLADYISSYLLDRYLEVDPLTRYAVEVLVKDDNVVLAGEVSSEAVFNPAQIADFVRKAIAEVGYTPQYAVGWGPGVTIRADRIAIMNLIRGQSPDIAQGVASGVGWGDQGIFWGMAVADPARDYLPADYWYAREIGRRLYAAGVGGIDIKTLVSTLDGAPFRVVCAIPLRNADGEGPVRRVINETAGSGVDIVLNGTGRFVVHGPIGDSGVTGRKLAVDFYGGNCRIGGGSPWGKDATKADVSLNLYARKLALAEVQRGATQTCFCSLACAIGQPDLEVALYDAGMRQIGYRREARPAREIIDELGLRKPGYAARCRNGLFSASSRPFDGHLTAI